MRAHPQKDGAGGRAEAGPENAGRDAKQATGYEVRDKIPDTERDTERMRNGCGAWKSEKEKARLPAGERRAFPKRGEIT